jgi:hypothetical protein
MISAVFRDYDEDADAALGPCARGCVLQGVIEFWWKRKKNGSFIFDEETCRDGKHRTK